MAIKKGTEKECIYCLGGSWAHGDLGKRALKLYREKNTLSEIVIIMLGMGRLGAAVLQWLPCRLCVHLYRCLSQVITVHLCSTRHTCRATLQFCYWRVAPQLDLSHECTIVSVLMVLQHRSSETYTYTEAHVGAGENFSVCEKKKTLDKVLSSGLVFSWKMLSGDT